MHWHWYELTVVLYDQKSPMDRKQNHVELQIFDSEKRTTNLRWDFASKSDRGCQVCIQEVMVHTSKRVVSIYNLTCIHNTCGAGSDTSRNGNFISNRNLCLVILGAKEPDEFIFTTQFNKPF